MLLQNISDNGVPNKLTGFTSSISDLASMVEAGIYGQLPAAKNGTHMICTFVAIMIQ